MTVNLDLHLETYIFVHAELTEMQLAEAEEAIRAHLGSPEGAVHPEDDQVWLTAEDWPFGWVRVNTDDLWSSEKYPQGWWPAALEYIQAMRATFPGLPIHFGPAWGIDDEIPAVSDDDGDQYWVKFLKTLAFAPEYSTTGIEWWQGVPVAAGLGPELSPEQAVALRDLADRGWTGTLDTLVSAARDAVS